MSRRMNRLRDQFEEPPEDTPDGDYFVLYGEFGRFIVPRDTGIALLTCLDERPAPTWLAFTDLFGSYVRVRTRHVHALFECTGGQRAAERSFDRARRLEEKADRRPWEDDD
jgi:hypothetical protein